MRSKITPLKVVVGRGGSLNRPRGDWVNSRKLWESTRESFRSQSPYPINFRARAKRQFLQTAGRPRSTCHRGLDLTLADIFSFEALIEILGFRPTAVESKPAAQKRAKTLPRQEIRW